MGKNLTAILSLVLRTLLVRQCAAMPTYPMVQAVPAGQTGPLGREAPLLTRVLGRFLSAALLPAGKDRISLMRQYVN